MSQRRGFWTAVVACAIALPALIWWGVSSYSHLDARTIHITDKEAVATHDGHEYRVYTDDETYVVKDSWVHPRFSSSHFYSQLKVNKTYRCHVYGWRLPLFSTFENINDCQGVKR